MSIQIQGIALLPGTPNDLNRAMGKRRDIAAHLNVLKDILEQVAILVGFVNQTLPYGSCDIFHHLYRRSNLQLKQTSKKSDDIANWKIDRRTTDDRSVISLD